jgi:hypothetical protein
MRKIRPFLLLFVLFVGGTVPSAVGQSRRPGTGRSSSESPFAERLWYGAFLGLGFGGTGFSSTFGMNVSPMVGYKILPAFSVGPRIGIDYTYQKFQGIKAFNLFDVELALFARLHVFRGFFLQGEIGTRSDQYLETDGIAFAKRTRTRPVQMAGIGYNFSGGRGGFGQEIAILYDFFVGSDIYSIENPWQYRIAFTYGF